MTAVSSDSNTHASVESPRRVTTAMSDVVFVLALVLVFLALALPRYRVGIDWGDEGFLAYGAVRVMEGQLPNRDFVSLQPPVSFYIVAAAFKVFGTSLLSLRGLGVGVYLCVALFLYAAARNLMSPAFAFAAALPATVFGIHFGFVPFAVWQGIMFTLAAMAFYLSAVFRDRAWIAFPAGMLTAASIFSRHDQGVYLVGSILILTILLRYAKENAGRAVLVRRSFFCWLAGAAMVTILFTLFCWVRGALPEMFKQLIFFPFHTYRKTSSLPFPHFSTHSSFSVNAVSLLFYAPILVGAAAVVWLIRTVSRKGLHVREAVLAFLLVWSALFYCQALTRSDGSHLLITLPPFFTLIVYLLRILLRKFSETNRWAIFFVVATGVAIFGVVWTVSATGAPDLRKANEFVTLERGGVRIEKGRWVTEFIRGVQDFVPRDRSILALPYQPMVYFLCERRNPTRWNYLWPGDQSEQEHVDLVEQAKHDPPAVIFMTDETQMVPYAPTIVDYTHSNYRHVGDFGRLSVYFPE